MAARHSAKLAALAENTGLYLGPSELAGHLSIRTRRPWHALPENNCLFKYSANRTNIYNCR